jgi:NAD(P)-dependent dehydrogenase (short-subunit alcohol dehydrogenase family)
LAKAGAKVIVPARDIEKAKRNLDGIPNVELEELDLANPNSIDTFAEKFLKSEIPLHLLINNAGIMWVPLRRDSRGFESQLASQLSGAFSANSKIMVRIEKSKRRQSSERIFWRTSVLRF